MATLKSCVFVALAILSAEKSSMLTTDSLAVAAASHDLQTRSMQSLLNRGVLGVKDIASQLAPKKVQPATMLYGNPEFN